MQRINLSLGVLAITCLVAQNLAAESRVLGGASGQSWSGGGGEIQAAVQIGIDEAEITNTPGDVVDFDFPGRPGWIFPQRADSTRSIAAAATLTSPNILTSGIAEELLLMVDGDLETAFTLKREPGGPQVLSFGTMLDFDLGARFGVNRIQFFPRNAPGFETPDFPFQNDYLRAYELLVNDGSENSRDESGRPVLTSFKLELQNDQPVVDLRIPPQYLRFLRLKSQTVVGFEIAEFRVFGEGFVPDAQYISDVYDLGADWAVWGKIRWIEETLGPEGLAHVRITTRAGHDDTPLEFTRPGPGSGLPWKHGAVATTVAGEQVALDDLEPLEALRAYRALPLEEKNRVALSLADHRGLNPRGEIRADPDAWTPWSAPYGQEGTRGITVDNIDDEQLGALVTTPGPRRYFQVRVELVSRNLAAATGVGQLAFTVFPPVAERIVGEIYPRQVELAVPVTFTYAVMPTRIRPGRDSGFDTFEIATPGRVEAIESIQVLFHDGRTEAANFSGLDLSWSALPTDRGADFGIEAVEDRRFRVRFPAITVSDLEADEAAVLKIRFRCRVLRYGTTLPGWAGNTGTGITGQKILAGNAAHLGPEDATFPPLGTADPRALSVDVPVGGGDVLINTRAVPRPFSPNGDGANDQTRISYDLSRVIGPVPVEVRVLDLAGHLVRRLFSGEQGGGHWSIPWDGTNDSGELVRPGIYLAHVDVHSAANAETDVSVVEVVY
jgi:hypothetical protein